MLIIVWIETYKGRLWELMHTVSKSKRFCNILSIRWKAKKASLDLKS